MAYMYQESNIGFTMAYMYQESNRIESNPAMR